MENEQDDSESNSISTYYDEEEESSSSVEEEEEEEEAQKRVRFRDQVTDSSSSDEEEQDQRNRPNSVVYVPLNSYKPQSKKPVQVNGAVIHFNEPERRPLVGMSVESNGVPKSTNVDSGAADNLSSSEDGDVRFSPLPIMSTSPVPPNVILPASEGREKIKQLESTDVDTKPPSAKGKCIQILIGIGKGMALLALLYFFICSLDTLSLGFRLIGGRTAGEIFRKSDVLQNPVVGLMIGILATVFVQSSSTSTSIIVGMVAAGFLEVPVAIPLIMGANIGTSITNTIVSLSQAGDRDQFRLAFAGATILDMFNWITVIVLLPLEIVSGYLYHLSNAMMNSIMPDTQAGGEFQLLSVFTNPLVDRIVQLDPEVIECWSNPACNSPLLNASLIREYCGVSNSITIAFTQTRRDTMGRMVAPIVRGSKVVENRLKCDFVFAGTPLSDAAAGAIILICSLVVLCGCLVLIVKLLSSVIQGHLASVIKKTINADIPYVPWVTGYLAIIVGAIMTFIVQSSSVFTSSITPLIGLGVISIERAYPLTLGSNVGTTTTALLASMAVEGKAFRPSMQIALCHMIFNLSGIALFYPISFLRFPIPMAKFLGTTTSKYRWFAIFYMVMMFGFLPAITILLSLGGPIPVLVFCALASIILLFIFTLTLIQRKKPTFLPPVLRTWKFLPAPLRSLEPYDKFFTSFKCCRKLKEKANNQSNNKQTNNDSTTNKSVELYQLGEDEV